MDEEVINDLYSRAKSKGYQKNREEFIKLLHNDSEVMNDMYSYVKAKGYKKDINSFSSLVGKGEAKPEAAPAQKKKFALDLSSEPGSSVSPKSTNPQNVMLTLDQNGLEKAMAKRQSVPTDMSGKPIFNPEKASKANKVVQELDKRNQETTAEKKKYGDIFDKQLNIKPNVADNKYLNERLSSINTNLMNNTEDNVVEEMKYQFGDLGFKFETTGALGDYMTVKAPNGKSKEVSLDNLLDSKSTKQAEELKKFIKDNTPAKGLFVLEKTMKEQDRKFNSEAQVDDYVKVIANEATSLNAKQKQFLAKKSELEKQYANLSNTPDNLRNTQEFINKVKELDNKKIALDSEMKSILQEEDKIKQKGKKLDTAVAKYSITKAKQGSWGGGIWNAILEGSDAINAGSSDLTIDFLAEVRPNEKMLSVDELNKQALVISKKLNIKGPSEGQSYDDWKKSLTETNKDYVEDEIDDYVKKSIKKETIPIIRVANRDVFGDTQTTKQWASLKEKDFWGGAILGVSKSLPAMIGGSGPAGWAQRTAQMYAQISDGLSKEMESNPEFDNISENEKLAVTMPIGIVAATLEELGFRNLKSSQGLINRITLNVLGKTGRGVTAKTFRELVENEVDGMLAKGALTLTAAGASEFETGAAQELAETKFKDVYNLIKGKEMFKTPDSISDLVQNVVVAGAQEAVGGFVLGTPSAVSAAYSEKGFLKMDDATFETFANMANDEKMQSAYITSLKSKITNGELTVAQAKEQLNNYRNSVGLFRQLPDNLDTAQRKEAMNLLKEKKDLENYVEGKDPALVVKQKNRITEINDSLTKLSEADAIQEQSTTEIPVQSEAGISETVETGVSETKPEVITEQVTQEEVTAPQTIIEEPTAPISEALNDAAGVYVYDGKKGQLTTIGQTVVLETPTEIIDLGNVDELADSTLADFGIQKEEELDITLNEDNSVNVSGKTYLNNYSSPDAAINQDKDGNYSVTLDTEDGQKRTFRGQQADQIVYQMKLKDFEQNGTDEQIEQANELADEAIRIEEEVRQPSAEREGKTTRKAKRKQRTLKQPKEPLTKAEREALQPNVEITQEAPIEKPIKEAATVQSTLVDVKAEESAVTESPTVKYEQDIANEIYDRADNENSKLRKNIDSDSPKLEYDGDNESIKKEIERYNRLTRKIEEDGSFSNRYAYGLILKLIRRGIDTNNTRKLTNALRKADLFYGYSREMQGGNNFTTLISDSDKFIADSYYVVEDKLAATKILTKLAKELGIEVASADTEANRKVEKIKSKENNTKDLLDLDTKDKDSLNRVLEYLDRADKSLDLDPNELNDVTRVMAVATAKAIVKTLKALVNAGITLQEAINNVSNIYNIASDKIIDALDIVSKINENKSEGISEIEAPGYNELSSEIDNQIKEGNSVEDVLDYVQESDVYKNATDVQRELLVRDVRKRFGLRQKSAPSVDKLFGVIKDIKKVTMREKDLLIKQIKDKAKGARESIQVWKKQTEELTNELNKLNKEGKINSKQVGAILKRFSKVNIFSEKSVGRFTDYMVKIFNDANYKDKLSKARVTLASLKKLSKNESKNANLRAVASEFVKIDPSLVDNIDKYNEVADKLKAAVDGSKIRKADVKFAETINIEDTISYIEETIEEQESVIKEEKLKELQDLFGVDASEFSAEEIEALLESDKDLSKDDEKIVRATIKKAFDIYSTVINDMLNTGIDPFTEEEVTFTEQEKDIIKRFMEIDPSKLEDTKEALRTVDSLINFIQNKSTAGMLKPIADFEGIIGGKKAESEGLKAVRLRKYWSANLGLALGKSVTSLPVLFEKMFKGVNRALRVEELTGLSDLINNSSKAESESNNIVKKYVSQFYKTKANGESFNSAYNDVERGVFAHVLRNVIGSESRMKKVFDKRKQEVLGAIELLSKNGNDSEIETAKILQKVYDKILDGSENVNDVRAKTDINNTKAVDYWVKEWSNKYESLSNLALNFYNKVLGRDLNFTPDRIRKLQNKMGDVNLEDIDSQFFANTDDVLYDKKSGSLIDKQENRSIPKDMYVDFSFDKKNANAMNDALTDLYTAFDIRKVGSFLKSESFRKIFPSAKDANLIDKRIKKFVRLTRKKTPFSNEEISDFLRKADKLAKFGVTASLASPSQPFKQTIPVMFSTAMNAGSVGLGASINRNFNNWLNDLGYAISNRGVESQAEIDSLNKLIDKAADMPLDKALKFLEKTNDKALKVLLVNFDVWIARASFKAYYEQYLKKQGLYETSETVQTDSGERTVTKKGIDYSKHKVNKEAANYAQRMVDRQQNISNHSLAGDFFTSEEKSQKAFVKMLMPFSSFRMNQSSRLGSDLSTLEYWNTSTKEDKIIALRSISGYVLEAAAYRALQIGFSLLMYSAAKSIMGDDDEEDDKKFVNNLLKGSAQTFMSDTFSPIPLADPFLQDAMSYSVEEIESLRDIPEEEKTKLFGSQEKSALSAFGTYGIPLEKAKDLYLLGRLAYTNKYTDSYGNKKEISQNKADKLKLLIAPLFVSSVIGVGSPDMTSIVKKSIKMSKNEDGMDMEESKKTDPEMYKMIKQLQEEIKKDK
jgi:hypothetical protein